MARINLTPLEPTRQQAIWQIEQHFQSLAMQSFHRENEWARKRIVAETVAAGGVPTAEFEAEAALRDMDAAALAEIVLSKPIPIDGRALARQTALLAVEKATSIDELSVIVMNMIKA